MQDIVEVRRRSPRFQLIKSEIDKLAPDGIYDFIASCEYRPVHFMITRTELERDFKRAMSTPSYLQGGRNHRAVWPKADEYRFENIVD